MKLYFKNSQGNERIIADVENEKEAIKVINKFCKERNFYIYYMRSWKSGPKEITYDVGSHTEFFVLRSFHEDIKMLEKERIR